MSIKQLNGSYIPNEDRILFRFNTVDNCEYRFWFTRRITLFVLAATEHLVEKQLEQHHPPSTARAMVEFSQESARAQTDLSVEYTPVSTFPLGADPIILDDVRCTLIPAPANPSKGQARMALDLILRQGQQLNLTLALPTLQSMRVLLERLVAQAQWLEGRPVLGKPATLTSPATEPVALDPKKIH
jgi:hypothetical protein